MLKRWTAWRPGIRWLAGIAALALVAAIAWALFVPLADWLGRHDVGPAKPAMLQTARDAARGRLLTLVAGLFAAGALVFTALNFNLSREGQVTGRSSAQADLLAGLRGLCLPGRVGAGGGQGRRGSARWPWGQRA